MAVATAIGMELLRGIIVWVIRRRQCIVRQRSIDEIRAMLSTAHQRRAGCYRKGLPRDDRQDVAEAQLESIQETIDQRSAQVDTLSEASVDDWKSKYEGTAQRTPGRESPRQVART